jgi:hypothetical protein
MNTTVTTESKYLGYGINVPSMTVNNIGLMDDRRNALTVSGLATILGVILFIAGSFQNKKQDATSDSISSQRKCPFCAESIKVEAVICLFCNRDLPAYTEVIQLSSSEPVKNHPYPKTCVKCNLRYPEEISICPECDLELS